MDETIYVILKVLFDFALEVWFSIYSRTLVARTRLSRTPGIARTRSSVLAISLYI